MGVFAEDSDGTIDSNSSEFYLRQEGSAPIPYRKRFKAVVKCWNDMEEATKNAWRVRAKKLNSRNLPGKVYFVPSKCILVVFNCFIVN